MKDKLLIGWKETLDLPELGIYGIEAKIDTGAASSVLHCNSYTILLQDGQKRIVCEIITNFKTGETKTIDFPVYRVKLVRSSFGHEEKRYYILTKAHLFGQLFNIKISFRNRSEMLYPMLLGRNFLYKKFVVDVSKANLSKKISQSAK